MIKNKMSLNPLAAAIALISGTICIPQIASAQEEVREDEEVLVVSARRRDETLQEVPISLSSFTGDQMEKTGVPDLVALGASVPNTTLKASRATNSTLTAFIRGVGQQDPLVGLEAGVGLYIDDVYLNRPQGAVLDVFEVERVEILRGPQGTLYGRNTIGGAIKYVTKRLSNETEASVKLAAGTYGQFDGIISGSTPLADDSLRIGGSLASFHRGGYGENVITGRDNYDKDIVSARVSLESSPSDSLFIRVAADAIRDTSNPRHGHREGAESILDGVYDTEAGVDSITSQNHPINKNELEGFGLATTVEYEISDTLTFKSVTAYRADESESIIDFDSRFPTGLDAPVQYENDQLSQEFQIGLNYERIQGLIGIYYLDAYAKNVFDFLVPNAIAYTFGEVDTASMAAFFDLSYDLTDTFALSLGARYTAEEKDFHSFRATYLIGDNGLHASPNFGGNGLLLTEQTFIDGQEVAPEFISSRSDNALTPKVSLSWQPVEEHHVYASYSQGFKGGGYDPRGNYSQDVGRSGFKPEFVDAYEIGIKSTFLDGSVSTNIAGFYSEYSDVQIPGSEVIRDENGNATGFDGNLSNAGEATMKGLEFDVTANLTDNLTSTLAVGILDAGYDVFVEEGVNLADSKNIQNAPDTSSSFSLSYSLDVGPGELNINGSADYTSSINQFEIPTILDQSGYTLFNLSVTWTSDDDHWQAGLHGRNLSDKEYKVAGYNFDPDFTAFYGDPRTITATLKYKTF
ncbi:MAG: TonB-dependent receptor [Agarilytica sp.]